MINIGMSWTCACGVPAINLELYDDCNSDMAGRLDSCFASVPLCQWLLSISDMAGMLGCTVNGSIVGVQWMHLSTWLIASVPLNAGLYPCLHP